MLSGVARVTAMEGSRHLSQLVGSPVHLKCENLQRTGSFKLRGAYVRIAGLLPEQRAAGVVAASAGNHAQGVALASSLLGVRSTVFMPQGAPLPKISATRDYGAEVRLHGQVVDETLAAAQEYAERTGAVFIHPPTDITFFIHRSNNRDNTSREHGPSSVQTSVSMVRLVWH